MVIHMRVKAWRAMIRLALAGATCLALGALAMLVWLDASREIGFHAYRDAAARIAGDPDALRGGIAESFRPEPTTAELRRRHSFCDLVGRETGLNNHWLGILPAVAGPEHELEVDDQALRRAWGSLGFLTRLRIAALGTGPEDERSVRAFIIGNRIADDLRHRLRRALSPCADFSHQGLKLDPYRASDAVYHPWPAVPEDTAEP